MQLPESRFDGVFANASLFHIPSREMPKVLLELLKTLKPRGVLFSSDPRGNNEEGLTTAMPASSISTLGAITSPRPASRRWAITTARRDYRGISSRGSRPFGARASALGPAHRRYGPQCRGYARGVEWTARGTTPLGDHQTFQR
jgi:SAM-dependent methyltransferase